MSHLADGLGRPLLVQRAARALDAVLELRERADEKRPLGGAQRVLLAHRRREARVDAAVEVAERLGVRARGHRVLLGAPRALPRQRLV